MNAVIISILLVIACIAAIVYIVGKKMSVLASIDTDALPEERAKQVKNKIINDRMERKLHTAKKMASVITSPFSNLRKNVGQRMGDIHKGVAELRDKQRRAAIIGGATASSGEPERKQEVAGTLLEQAQQLVDDERFDMAEKRYIDAIALDANNIEAYEGLAELYLAQKDWSQAQEVLEYVCKREREVLAATPPEEQAGLPARLGQHLYDLSQIHADNSEDAKALEEISEAVALDKNNPKLLDALVDMYISQKQRLRAERALEQLRRANPDNNKLEDLARRIEELPY